MSCHNVVLFRAVAVSAGKENKLRQYGVTHEMRFPQRSYRAQRQGSEKDVTIMGSLRILRFMYVTWILRLRERLL